MCGKSPPVDIALMEPGVRISEDTAQSFMERLMDALTVTNGNESITCSVMKFECSATD